MSTIQLISAEDAEKINTEEKVIRVTINKKGSPFEYRKFVRLHKHNCTRKQKN